MPRKYFLAIFIFVIINMLSGSQFVKCTIERVLDSETIRIIAYEDINIFQKDKGYTIRLAGVTTEFGVSNNQSYVRNVLEYIAKALTYKTVYLELHGNMCDKYGRILVYVWLEPPAGESEEEIKTKLFNYLLVRDGYASVIINEPQLKYLQHLLSAAQIARYINYGIWYPSNKQERKNADNESTTLISTQQ